MLRQIDIIKYEYLRMKRKLARKIYEFDYDMTTDED